MSWSDALRGCEEENARLVRECNRFGEWMVAAEREAETLRTRAERAEGLLRELMAAGYDDIDPRLGYVVIHIDRDDLAAVEAFLAEAEGDG